MRLTRDRFLSDAELARFMAAVRSRRHKHQPRDHAFFALLANTGIRPSEALGIRGRDCHLKARPPWVRVTRASKKHGPQPVTDLVLNREVAAVLARHRVDNQSLPLFSFSKRQAQRLFHYYARFADLHHPHRIYHLRHTVGVRLWRHTKDLRLIQAIMGHIRLKASAAYVHVTPETMRVAFEKAGVVQ